MLFYNEHATTTRVQHRTSCDCRNQWEYIVAKKLQQQQIYFEVFVSLPHICPLFSSICPFFSSICPLFSHYHLYGTELQEVPASSTLACKYIVGHFFVRSSFLLHSTHACCCCASIVERPLRKRKVVFRKVTHYIQFLINSNSSVTVWLKVVSLQSPL